MRRISFFLIVWMVLLSYMVAGESTTVLGPVKSMLVEGDNVKYEYFYSRTGVLIEEKNWLTGVDGRLRASGQCTVGIRRAR